MSKVNTKKKLSFKALKKSIPMGPARLTATRLVGDDVRDERPLTPAGYPVRMSFNMLLCLSDVLKNEDSVVRRDKRTLVALTDPNRGYVKVKRDTDGQIFASELTPRGKMAAKLALDEMFGAGKLAKLYDIAR